MALEPPIEMKEIESGDVSGMMHSSSAELLQEINDKRKVMRLGPWAVVATFLLVPTVGLFLM